MAQFNFSAEEQLNMNKDELAQAQSILLSYSKKTENPSNKNRWQAAAKKIGETSKTLETVIAEAERAGIKFEEGEKSILTIAEVGKRMRAHKNENGNSYEMDESALGVDDITLSNTLGDKAKDLMNDPNASQKISTGILGFAAAEFAFSALGFGGALGAGQSLLTSVLPLIGDGLTALWGCSSIGVMALGVGVFIKAYPFLKKLKDKFTQQQTRDLQGELESIRQGGGSAKKSSIFKEVENKKEEQQNGNGQQQTGNGQKQTGNGQQQTGNGQQQTGNGQQQTGNGQQQTGNGQQQTGNGQQQTGNGQQQTGNGQQQTGNGQQQTGNGQQQTGNGQQQTGNGQQQNGNGQQQTGNGQQQTGNGQQQNGNGQQQNGNGQQQNGNGQQNDNNQQPEQDKELDAVLEALGVESGDAQDFKEAVETIKKQIAEASKISTTLTESLPEKDDEAYLYVGCRKSQDPSGSYFEDAATGIKYIDPEHTVEAEMSLEDCKKQKEEVNKPAADKNQTITDLVQSSNEISQGLAQLQDKFDGKLSSVISNYLTILNNECDAAVKAIRQNQADAAKEFDIFNKQIDGIIEELEQELNNTAEQEIDEEPEVEEELEGGDDTTTDDKEDEKEDKIENKIENLPPTIAQKLKGVGDKVLGYLTSRTPVSGHTSKYMKAENVRNAMQDPDYIAKEILGMSPEEYTEFTASENGGLVTDMLSAYLQVKSNPKANGKAAAYKAEQVAKKAVEEAERKAAEEAEAAAQQAGE